VGCTGLAGLGTTGRCAVTARSAHSGLYDRCAVDRGYRAEKLLWDAKALDLTVPFLLLARAAGVIPSLIAALH
jgi:hypothetical protein